MGSSVAVGLEIGAGMGAADGLQATNNRLTNRPKTVEWLVRRNVFQARISESMAE